MASFEVFLIDPFPAVVLGCSDGAQESLCPGGLQRYLQYVSARPPLLRCTPLQAGCSLERDFSDQSRGSATPSGRPCAFTLRPPSRNQACAACETGLHPWAPSSTRPGPKTMWADSWAGRRTGGYASSFLAVWLGRLHLFLSLCGCQPTAPQEAACAMDTSGAGALKCLWGTRSALEPGGILGGPGACCP